MVDVEKPEHGEMSVPEEPKQKEEGGDAKAATTAEENRNLQNLLLWMMNRNTPRRSSNVLSIFMTGPCRISVKVN